MGGLKHDIAKKQHRERAQPLERKKWGLLEKKKDYKLRAADFHRKENQLKILRNKASTRNADEFHHAMVNSKTDKRGIIITEREGSAPMSVDAVKLLKTQDAGYVKTLSSVGKKQIERLESELLLKSSGKHTVFVDTEKQAVKFNPAEFFDTDEALVERRENRLRKSQLEDTDNSISENKFKTKQRLQKMVELDQRLKNQQELNNVQYEMDLQRELMKKGDKKKLVGKDGRVTYKWKNVRKK